ncbi:TGS domain-containing protein [Ignisphaera sp. 4213-co]|uniref:TGS domain-containing protein n=1 Tax=Ignisphaera cupida TaxID=3050454 RepID=A0ABD4Z6Q0_9CREN|nr:TGS domain-containing protein [Ignisphaera sp. 4213-co]MDK6028414.1 TGS domain-containing protein [Ignisphaera sp. 4213-co]
MVTNLPAEAKAKFVKYMEAKTPEEKLRALEEFLSAVPKHKGTENLVRWIRKRMAELREEVEEKKQRKTGSGLSFFVEKEGAAQLVLLGLTKSGKSALLKFLTGAKVEVSDVPYTTKFPAIGMMQYKDIQFQIVEAPSIIPNGGGWNTKVAGLAKNSDGIIIVLDATRDYENDFKLIIDFLNDHGIVIEKPKGFVEFEKRHAGGIRIINYGKLVGTEDEVIKLLNSYRIYNAIVKIYGEVNIDDVEKAIFERTIYKPALILINKIDALGNNGAALKIGFLNNFKIPVFFVSAIRGFNKDVLGNKIFELLNIVRIYTKPPNGEPSSKPLVLKKGSTVQNVAEAIHKDFVRKFAYARVWGSSVKYPGQRVGLDHVLHDGDIVEIVLKK